MGTITKKAFPVLNMHCAGCANKLKNSSQAAGHCRCFSKPCHQYTLRLV